MITCVDNTNGKLYFAAELLSFLNESRKDVCLILDDTNQYRELLNHFPAISIKNRFDAIPDNIIIEISDQIHQPDLPENINCLLYPVGINADEYNLPQLCFFRANSYCVPFADPQVISKYANADLSVFIELLQKLEFRADLKEKKILISAGPTAEDIDPVRFFTNRSSGKMGIALAKAAFTRGAEVTLVCGPNSVPLPPYLNVIQIRSAKDMADIILEHFPETDVYIGAAAVADYTPDVIRDNKIKKEDGGLNITFKRTTDILISLAKVRKNQVMVGFSLETENILENSRKKLINKNLDMIVINNPKTSGAAFSEDTNVVTIMEKKNSVENLPKMSKFELANKILDRIKPYIMVKKK